MADQAHPAQHDEHADQPAQGAGDRRDGEAVAEELELERLEQVGRAAASRRTGASTTTRWPALLEHLHARAVGLLEHVRAQDVLGASVGDDDAVQARETSEDGTRPR